MTLSYPFNLRWFLRPFTIPHQSEVPILRVMWYHVSAIKINASWGHEQVQREKSIYIPLHHNRLFDKNCNCAAQICNLPQFISYLLQDRLFLNHSALFPQYKNPHIFSLHWFHVVQVPLQDFLQFFDEGVFEPEIVLGLWKICPRHYNQSSSGPVEKLVARWVH